VQPMLATPTPTPGRLPDGPAWLFEVKWDGVRILADTTADRLRLVGRNGRDAALAYPELDPIGALPAGTVVDGEVLLMRDGIPSFPARVRSPVSYLVFDVPVLAGEDLTRRPLTERRAALETLDLPEHVQLSPAYDDGALIWDATRAQGLEGVVAKRRTSAYQPGRRSTDWLKAVHHTTQPATCASCAAPAAAWPARWPAS
jgi:bifunctional non-homologous end joining protein LigD